MYAVRVSILCVCRSLYPSINLSQEATMMLPTADRGRPGEVRRGLDGKQVVCSVVWVKPMWCNKGGRLHSRHYYCIPCLLLYFADPAWVTYIMSC